jgi:hypothetical protein
MPNGFDVPFSNQAHGLLSFPRQIRCSPANANESQFWLVDLRPDLAYQITFGFGDLRHLVQQCCSDAPDNLDIFSRFAVGDLKLPTVQRALDSENDPFKIGERRKPSTAKGIITERYKPGPTFEELG